MSARRLSQTTITARRPGARTKEAYQTLDEAGDEAGGEAGDEGDEAGLLDKRPGAHYYAAVVHLNAVTASGRSRP
jgi:hypothetical protein